MTGPVVLCGGSEFEEASIPLNRAVLRLVAKKQPRIAIVPIVPNRGVVTALGYGRPGGNPLDLKRT